MSRLEAIEKLKKPAISSDEVKHEFEYIAKKLDLTVSELNNFFNLPNKTHHDYKNSEALINLGAKLLKLFRVEKAIKR